MQPASSTSSASPRVPVRAELNENSRQGFDGKIPDCIGERNLLRRSRCRGSGKCSLKMAPGYTTLLEETNASGVAQADYIYLNRRPIAVLNGSTIYYLHTDRLGSPQIATDSSQNIVWKAIYDPFGQTPTLSGTITQNLRLPGQYADQESGFYQNGFRDYVAPIGRYEEPDPLGRLGRGNDLYVYVGDNPTNLVDPLGLCPRPKDNCDRRGPAVQVALSGGAAIVAPFTGGSVSVNIGVNVDGWNSSAFIQGQANGGVGGGAFAGWGVGVNVSHGTDTTTGLGSADYAEVDAGAGLDLTGSIAHDENGCSYSGGKGLKGGEGVGLGTIAGKSGTATLATPSLGSIINWIVNNPQYF